MFFFLIKSSPDQLISSLSKHMVRRTVCTHLNPGLAHPRQLPVDLWAGSYKPKLSGMAFPDKPKGRGTKTKSVCFLKRFLPRKMKHTQQTFRRCSVLKAPFPPLGYLITWCPFIHHPSIHPSILISSLGHCSLSQQVMSTSQDTNTHTHTRTHTLTQ